MTRTRQLVSLVAGQLALAAAASALAHLKVGALPGFEHILIVPFCGLVLCQALLLAVWGAISTAAPHLRAAGLVLGAAYLELLVPHDLRREFQGVISMTIAVTFAALLVARGLGVRLTHDLRPTQQAGTFTEGLKFSIRDLMLLIAALALLSAVTRALRESRRDLLLLAAVWAMCFVALGLGALWAGLGDDRPLRRGSIVVALSPVLGAFFAYALTAHGAGWLYIILIMVLYTALLLGSLLAFRSRGYRVVRRAAPDRAPES
jgi:hypothetical protein